eukprot:g68115.t1
MPSSRLESLLSLLGQQAQVSAVPSLQRWVQEQKNGFCPSQLSRRDLTYFAQLLMLGTCSRPAGRGRVVAVDSIATSQVLAWMHQEGFDTGTAIQLGQRLLDEGLITQKSSFPLQHAAQGGASRFVEKGKDLRIFFSHEVREFRLEPASVAFETLRTIHGMAVQVTGTLSALQKSQQDLHDSLPLYLLLASYILTLLHSYSPLAYHLSVAVLFLVLAARATRKKGIGQGSGLSRSQLQQGRPGLVDEDARPPPPPAAHVTAFEVKDSEVKELREFLKERYPDIHANLRDGYLRLLLAQPQSKGDEKTRRTVAYAQEKLLKCLALHAEHGTFNMRPDSDSFQAWFEIGDNYVEGFTQWAPPPSEGKSSQPAEPRNVPIYWFHKTRAWNATDPNVDFASRLLFSSALASNLPPEVESWVMVVYVDPSAAGLRHVPPRALASKVLSLLSQAFPDRVYRTIVGPVDSGVMLMWKIMAPLMPRNMRNKMILTKDLSQTLLDLRVCSPETLPDFLGGPARHQRQGRDFAAMLESVKSHEIR